MAKTSVVGGNLLAQYFAVEADLLIIITV
uniref:Uncharacterized protein n=1 Tax=Rhizophora mucronata TaxID=61149 RepID=A0A2P2P8T4_RHIMU